MQSEDNPYIVCSPPLKLIGKITNVFLSQRHDVFKRIKSTLSNFFSVGSAVEPTIVETIAKKTPTTTTQSSPNSSVK